MVLTILFIGLAVLLVFSVPIFLALILPTFAAFHVSGLGLPLNTLIQRGVQGINNFQLLAIPLFVYAADVISRGEIGKRLVDVSEALVGWIPGGLAIATIIAMAIFGAISGIGVAAIITLGPIVYPALRREGYGKSFALGIILSGATLSMLVPPSVGLILYALQSRQSIAQLFLVGLAVALIKIFMMSGYSVIYAVRKGIGVGTHFSLRQALTSLRNGVWSLLLPVIIIGGIYSGFFTPTEAAAVSCVYAIVVETLIYRRLKWRNLLKLSGVSAGTIAMILILIVGGTILTFLLTVENVPNQITQSLGTNSLTVRWVANGIYLAAGMLVDPNSIMIVLTPLISPAASAAGINLLAFGGMVATDVAIGMITPPFGMNLFVGMLTFKVSFADVVKGCWPFIVLFLITLSIITFVPETIMWLPHLSSVR